MGYTHPVPVTGLAVLKSKSIPSERLPPNLAGSARLPKVPFRGPLHLARVTNILYCHNITLWGPHTFADYRERSEFSFLSSLSQPLVLSDSRHCHLPCLLFSPFPSVIMSRDVHCMTPDRSSEDAAHMHVSGPDVFVQCWWWNTGHLAC